MNLQNENETSNSMMRLKVGRPCVQKLMDSGQLRAVKMSKRIIQVLESALKEFIEQAKYPHPPAPQVKASEQGYQPEASPERQREG